MDVKQRRCKIMDNGNDDDMIDYGCVSLFNNVEVELKELPWMMSTLNELVEQERQARFRYFKDLELTRPSREWFTDILDRITGRDKKDYHDIRSKKRSLLKHCVERGILFRCNICQDPVVFESLTHSFHCTRCDRNDRKVLYDPDPGDGPINTFIEASEEPTVRSKRPGPLPPPPYSYAVDPIPMHQCTIDEDLPIEDLIEALEIGEEGSRCCEDQSMNADHSDDMICYPGDKIFGAPIVCQNCGTLVGSWYNEFPADIPTTYLEITCPECSEVIIPSPVYLPRRKRDNRMKPPPGRKRRKGLNP